MLVRRPEQTKSAVLTMMMSTTSVVKVMREFQDELVDMEYDMADLKAMEMMGGQILDRPEDGHSVAVSSPL
jgi:hypothetical protein